MGIREEISQTIDLPESFIDDTLRIARRQIKIFKIPKINGSYRTIYQPSRKVKTLQYWLLANLLEKLPVHPSAVAYIKGLSILDNAKLHKKNCYFLKIDLKNFFPSIRFSDLFPRIEAWHQKNTPSWELDSYAKKLIRLTCFVSGDILPIGYPTSPTISNVVMYDFDVRLENLIKDKEKFGEATYTRYADDLVFSTRKKGACAALLSVVSKQILQCKYPKIVINSEKTKLGSSRGGTGSVTGLKIGEGGKISIHRNQKDHIRLMLSLYKKGSFKEDEYLSLLGHLSYIHHVEPSFYSKLQKKYYNEISEIKIWRAKVKEREG